MAITSKKLLSSLSALSVVGLSASSVVACGFNMDKIINRKISTDTYNSTFSYPVTSFNTAYTMQSEDQTVLANSSATLISIDQYGRTYGDIFKSNSDLKSQTVGTTTDSITWEYEVREGLQWKTWDGKEVAYIQASDLYKTAYFALNSKVTSSAVGTLWRGFIKGAVKATNWLEEGEKGKTYDEFLAYAKDPENGFGLECTDGGATGGGTVKFTLTKAAPYFESLISYSAFSPVYTTTTDKITDFKKGVYSGAYLPKSVSSTKMSLVKNDDYHFASEVSVKNINYIFAGSSGVQATRTMFEAGDITGFSVSSADTVGWNRYVGDDVNNPVFDQAYDVPSSRSTSTFGIFFNTYNSKLSGSNKQQYVNASKILQLKEARALISTGLNRSDFVRYYSGKYDGKSEVSSMLRNTYTAPTVGIDGATDYTQYIASQAEEKAGGEAGINSTKLADGTDYLLNNSQEIMGQTRAQLIEKIKAFMAEEGITDSRVKLEFLINSDQNATLNPYLNRMFDRFNAIEGNPLEIVAVDTASSADYQDQAQKGAFDLYSSGWGPDYADPATFLSTLTIGGDMNNYTGTARFIKENEDGTGYEIANDELKTKDGTTTEEYLKAFTDYTTNVRKIDAEETSDKTKRFQAFADEEYRFMYDQFLLMPVYKAALPKNFVISHAIPYTTTYISTYGISNYKLFTQKLSEKLLTAEELKKVFADYATGLQEISKDYSWKKEERAFWK